MVRPSLKHVLVLSLTALTLGACGQQSIELDREDRGDPRAQRAAELFNDKCAGCHTLQSAAAEGSAVQVRDRERVDGPNFEVRPEQRDAILYAIRNGGFSGAIMPENIVVGEDAELLADYLAKYAGRKAEKPITPQQNTPGESDSDAP